MVANRQVLTVAEEEEQDLSFKMNVMRLKSVTPVSSYDD